MLFSRASSPDDSPAERSRDMREAETAALSAPTNFKESKPQLTGNRCQYTGKLLRPDEGSLDHVLPRSRGGKDEWGNLVWSDKAVNVKKGNRLPHEAGLNLLTLPRAPKELPVTVLIRNAHRIMDWKLFVKE